MRRDKRSFGSYRSSRMAPSVGDVDNAKWRIGDHGYRAATHGRALALAGEVFDRRLAVDSREEQSRQQSGRARFEAIGPLPVDTRQIGGSPFRLVVGQGDHMVALSNSGGTAVTLHLARLATQHGADLPAVCSRPHSELARLASATLVVPVTTSTQFGGSFFEQCALILLDALILQLTADDADSYRRMAERHANLE